jgi:hypothetical protein
MIKVMERGGGIWGEYGRGVELNECMGVGGDILTQSWEDS